MWGVAKRKPPQAYQTFPQHTNQPFGLKRLKSQCFRYWLADFSRPIVIITSTVHKNEKKVKIFSDFYRIVESAEVAMLRELRRFLKEADPKQEWGRLKKILTPEGQYLWLCEEHAKEYAN